ncbi:RDD family protein [Epilithonimonas sp.]|uniref:RDD family protein n=1 Tax=Epilithonimonas sp. TaxID=2894511 RepID=UPI0028A26A3D|nr:RDD family protein [Epilithonimonas sp.]
MKNNSRIVDRNQAEKLLRFVNFLIDYFFTYLLVILFYAMMMFIYSFVSGIDYLTVADKVAGINSFLDRLVTAFFYALFMYLTEMISKGRSLGKLITGTMVVNENGGLPTGNDFLKRNFSRIVPFDALSFFGSNGWHDSWSDTKVVKRKAYLEAVERENSIEDIGQIAS